MNQRSKVPVYCNNCGKLRITEFVDWLGSRFKVCSMDCFKDMEVKWACSMVGQEYPPKKKDAPQDKDPT
jgi:hypothetical protein